MELKEWVANRPVYFPALFYETPPNHNPLIGTTQSHTTGNVHDVLRFVYRAVASSQRDELQLNANETYGLCHIIDACGDALQFEATCRPDGGEPADENGDVPT